jgi:hypothetical protein
MAKRSRLLALLLLLACGAAIVEFVNHRSTSGILVETNRAGEINVQWPVADGLTGRMLLNLASNQPLIRSFGFSKPDGTIHPIIESVNPVMALTIGERDPVKAAAAYQQMVFFENPRERPHHTYPVQLTKNRVTVTNSGSRTTLIIGEAAAGSFKGDFRLTFYRSSPLVRAEYVLTTDEKLRAILYDTGLSSRDAVDWGTMVWQEPLGDWKRTQVETNSAAVPVAVGHRAMAMEGPHGSLAIFPAPHQYFYPLDFAENFKFTWFGRNYGVMPEGFGFGIRQPLEGDKRWVPWIDAPAGTQQHLAVFYLIATGHGEEALKKVAAYTHGDRFKELPGYKTFTSHYHIEHTLDFLAQQKKDGTNGVPAGLEVPGFVKKFKETGVNIVHLAEFHQGWTPTQKTADRLPMLKTLHSECARLSDGNFLLLPGEEPNVHLGGHWLSFFPKPIYWVLNRSPNEPFSEQIPGYGTVYHVGNPSDVLRLMEQENGLMWTAHPRIKGSLGFPDGYKDTDFFKSDHFLGAGWKALPSNLSKDRLGWRTLDLLDDMNQWGAHKQALGEVDVFQVQPDYELYAQMNINYLQLDSLPKFADGWQPILTTLREGRFFTTTGEILIPKFSVAGKHSGETVDAGTTPKAELQAQLEWTFPLAFAEIISGDGKTVQRQRIDLSDTQDFGSRTLTVPVELKGREWIRFEVWDVAANGAFTQPVWIK